MDLLLSPIIRRRIEKKALDLVILHKKHDAEGGRNRCKSTLILLFYT